MSSKYKEALAQLKSVKEGRAKATEALFEDEENLIREVDEEEFEDLKAKRSVKGFIVNEEGDDEGLDEEDDDDLEVKDFQHSSVEEQFRKCQGPGGRKRHRDDIDLFEKEILPKRKAHKNQKSLVALFNKVDVVDDTELLKDLDLEEKQEKSIIDKASIGSQLLELKKRFRSLGSKRESSTQFAQAPQSAEFKSADSSRHETPIVSSTENFVSPDAAQLTTPLPKSPQPSSELPISSSAVADLNETSVTVTIDTQSGVDDQISVDRKKSNDNQVKEAPHESDEGAKIVGQSTDIHSGETVDEQDLLRKLLGEAPWELKREATSSSQIKVDKPLEADNKDVQALFGYEDDKGHPYINLYYMDALEEVNGRVILFGKLMSKGSTESYPACVTIDYIPRNVYLRPKEQPHDVDDPEERRRVVRSLSGDLMKILSIIDCPNATAVPKIRRVVFDRQSKDGSEALELNKRELYIKLSFPATFRLPSACTFLTDSFSHVFGLRTSPLEALLIKRRIFGPGWLKLYGAIRNEDGVKQRGSIVALKVTSYKNVSPLIETTSSAPQPPPPALVTVTLNFKAVRSRNQFSAIILCLSGNRNFLLTEAAEQSSSESKVDTCLLAYLNPKIYSNDSKKPGPFTRTFTLLKDFACAFIEAISQADPDVLIAHDLYGSTIPLLGQMLSMTNPPTWTKLARYQSRGGFPPFPSDFNRMQPFQQGQTLFTGRLLCDTYKLSQEALGSRTDYTLRTLLDELGQSALANVLISEEEIGTFLDIWIQDIPSINPDVYPTVRKLVDHMRHTAQNANLKPTGSLMIKLMAQSIQMETSCVAKLVEKLNLLNLTKELAWVAGSQWSRSLFCQRAERNECLLLHKFREEKIIPPGIEHRVQRQAPGSKQASQNKKKDLDSPSRIGDSAGDTEDYHYEGGLVLEPRSGYYDTYILYLDFASLYPSIIQEFNLCFTTCVAVKDSTLMNPDSEKFVGNENELGVLPRLLQDLVKRRRQVKSQLATSTGAAAANLQIRQKALKLVANSIYGSLGFPSFRFFAPHIAATVTAWGRHILTMTKDRVEKQLGCTVIYGDTDSLMVDSGLRDERGDLTNYYLAQTKARSIVQEVNKFHNKLELEVEGIFKKLLLLRKKKYAGLKVVDPVRKIYEKELKGIDIVRRDWCGVTKALGHQLIELIFNQNVEDSDALGNAVVELLQATRDKMKNNQLPLDSYVITKALTKAPEAYANPKQSPHVIVALEMRRMGAHIHAGLEIPYVVCVEPRSNEESKASISDRAYHPSVVKQKGLTVDVAWYTNNQVFPPILRLCQFIQSLNALRLKEALGCTNIGSGGMEGTFGDGAVAVDVFEAQSSNLDELKAMMKLNASATEMPLGKDVICSKCSASFSLEDLIASGVCNKCEQQHPLTLVFSEIESYIYALLKAANEYKIRCSSCNHISSFGGCCRDCGKERGLKLVLDHDEFEGRICTIITCLIKRRSSQNFQVLLDLAEFHAPEFAHIINALNLLETNFNQTIASLKQMLRCEVVDLRPIFACSLGHQLQTRYVE